MDPKLAETLKTIGEDPMSFYTGELAENILEDLHEYGKKDKIYNY